MRSVSLRVFIASLSGALLLSLLFVIQASAATDCSSIPGTRAATAEDAAVKKGEIAVGTCYNPNDIGINQSAEQAKSDLSTMWCGGRPATCGSYTSTITQLDPKFAQCADKFMQQLRQQDPSACIRSAYRSTAHQVCACGGNPNGIPGKCAPAGMSYHQRGLAIDVNHRVPNQALWQIAAQSGLGNPPGLHVSDPDHLQVMNGGQNCASLGYMPTDTDAFVPGPASNNPYFGYGPNPLPSMQPLSSPAGQPTLPTTPAQSQAQSCNPTYSCSANTMYYQTSTCATQVYQLCTYGCNVAGSACNTSPANASSTNATSSSVNIGTSTDVSNTNTNTNDNGPSTSVSDILNSLVTGHDLFSSTDIGTSAPLTLITATHQIASLQASSTLYPAGTVFASGTIISVQPVGGQSTFTSQDLGNLPSYVPPQNNFALSVLENMKNALLGALNFLRSLVHA